MSSQEKGLRSPCQHVIEWRITQPDCDEREKRTLEAIQEDGITEPRQAELLAHACHASGAYEVCGQSEDC